MKKGVAFLELILFLALLSGLLVMYRSNSSLKVAAVESAQNGGGYLLEVLNEDGSFDYHVDAMTGKSLGGYNILRHAGTTYSLLELYEKTGDKEILSGAEKALDYLRSKTTTCFEKPEEVRCVLDGKKVKLGGNALAILAYSKHAEVTGEDKYIEEAESLARWIVSTQSQEGEFQRHIEFIDTGKLDDHISAYYPGEAIFALARLYKETGEERWLSSARYAADWLINVRDKGKGPESLLHDHWLLYGLNELYQIEPNEVYLNHAKLIASSIVVDQNKGYTGAKEAWNGGYFVDPDTTPAATRTEGLVAAYRLFDEAGLLDSAIAHQTLSAIEEGVKFLLRGQVTDAKVDALGFHPSSLGGFPESFTETEIRIDFVQHSISALLGYDSITS